MKTTITLQNIQRILCTVTVMMIFGCFDSDANAKDLLSIEADTLQGIVINPPDANGRFGQSVSDAGDVNGDGFDDIIIGAVGYPYLIGKAFVYFGGPVIETIPDLVLTNGEYFFGGSVSKAGDVNGDGYSDVIAGVGHYVFNTNGTVHIYFGSANMDNIPDVVISQGGKSVSNAGDVNGDGFDDVITCGGYIYFGGISMDNIPDVVVGGYPVSDAGDVNGDGFDDVIIAAAWPTAHLYFGGVNMDSIPDLIINTNEELYDFQVSDAGDVNGDGFADVMVSTPDGGLFRGGKVFVYFGGSSMDNIADIILTGTENFQHSGYRISSAGDINGDGFSDVISGMFNTKVHLYYGGPAMDNIPDATIPSIPHNMPPDMWVSSAGDFNGDGVPEMLVGIGASNYPSGVATLYDMNWDPDEPLNGTYTVGNGGFFPTITSAANKLNENGISGNVSFEIIAGTYSDTVEIDSIPGSGPLSRVLFCTRSGNRDVVLESQQVNITINGADYIAFKNLTFTGLRGSAVELTGEIECIEFSQNDFRRFRGITSADTSTLRDLRVIGNTFVNHQVYVEPQYALGLYGYCRNTCLRNNYVSINTAGFYLYNQDSLSIEDNGITGSAGSMNYMTEPAILLSNCRGNLNFQRNIVYKSNFRMTTHPFLIYDCNFDHGVIANNSVSGASGIIVGNSSGLKIVHNNLSGDELAISVGSCNDIILTDNLITRGIDRYDNLATGICISSSNIICDFNNYFTSFGYLYSPWFYVDTTFGCYDGLMLNKFDDWKSITRLDVHSTTSKALISGLNLTGSSRFNPKLRGLYAGVDEDFEGDQRDRSFPFKGVDEPLPAPLPSGCSISGNVHIEAHSSETYFQDSVSWGWWELLNQNNSAAFIEKSNEYACIVNAGDRSGQFLLSYVAFDSSVGADRTFCNLTVSIDQPLPVELVSFTSTTDGNSVLLAWSTSGELNNSGFEIQRAIENEKLKIENWSSIGFVSGCGTTNVPKEYSYSDRNLVTGKYMYRLKQIDFNGNFEYYDLAEAVTIGVPDKFFMDQNYPNPFNPATTIAFGIPEAGNVTLKIFDMAGREIKTLVNEFKDAGYYSAKFDASGIASGVYVYRVESGNYVSVKKMVLLK